jgi:hypothetical protein
MGLAGAGANHISLEQQPWTCRISLLLLVNCLQLAGGAMQLSLENTFSLFCGCLCVCLCVCLQPAGGAIRSLVLAPTRELAAQIKAEAVKLLQPHGSNIGVQVRLLLH